jgi:hypothetical protein
MARNYLDEMLIDALQYASVRELPNEAEEGREWLKALALVSKKNGSKAYVALAKGKMGEDKIVKDFGEISAVAKVEKIYPFLYVEQNTIPQFKTNTKKERLDWLYINDPDNEYSEEMSMKELKAAVMYVVSKKK